MRSIALAVLLVTAGCLGSAQTHDNPWGADPVRVYIDKQLPPDDVEHFVVDALDYWEENAEDYTEFSVNFTLTDDERRAHLIIAFRDDLTGLDKCGIEGPLSYKMGCAPVHTEAGETRQSTIYIWRGVMNKDHADTVVKHEIGHTLGLNHSDPPADVMHPDYVIE